MSVSALDGSGTLPGGPAIPAAISVASTTDGPNELDAGCYALRLDPVSSDGSHLDGTLRVDVHGARYSISGDLYSHADADAGDAPHRTADVPVFATADYRYYLSARSLSFGSGGEVGPIALAAYAYDGQHGRWRTASDVTVTLGPVEPPTGAGWNGPYLVGAVESERGEVIGTLGAAWVSQTLRRAVIEIDAADGSEVPLENGLGQEWQDVMGTAGWRTDVEVGGGPLRRPHSEEWTKQELHAAMLALRENPADDEWRYHLLCVPRLKATGRGLMYDHESVDSNKIPREGAAIASHWTFPTEPRWGTARGRRFGAETAPYFRTAIHELGHAFGLRHNTEDTGLMNTTNLIGDAGAGAFPGNISWAFHEDDRQRLQHLPDPWVRPGGLPFQRGYASSPSDASDSAAMTSDLSLTSRPLLPHVPLGAPVRVVLRIENRDDVVATGPAGLSFADAAISGRVTGPDGTRRGFRPLFGCSDAIRSRTLAPGERLENSLTLYRGPDGPLFAEAGQHTITIDVAWSGPEGLMHATTDSGLEVTPPSSRTHEAAAGRLLGSADAFLAMVIGGDHLQDGIATVGEAMECGELRDHVAWLEAKRLAQPFFARPPRLDQALTLMGPDTVMSPAELLRGVEIAGPAEPEIALLSDDLDDYLGPAAAPEPSNRQAFLSFLARKAQREKAPDYVQSAIAAA